MKSEQIQKLCEYAEADGSELGDAIDALIALSRYDYILSESLNDLIQKEMESQLENFQENCEIVEEIVATEYKVVSLEWND